MYYLINGIYKLEISREIFDFLLNMCNMTYYPEDDITTLELNGITYKVEKKKPEFKITYSW